MKLLQQAPDCSDFDVTLAQDNSPAFRVLLPEWIRGNGIQHSKVFHVIPGKWKSTGSVVAGQFAVDEQLAISVVIEGRSCAIDVRLAVVNTSDRQMTDLWADICTSVNHLPGNPGWCNRQFLPALELDRNVQGRYWYEKVTPTRLFALTGPGWVRMHPQPDAPDASSVPLYSFDPSPAADAHACAVESVNGRLFFFQVWQSPCRWCTPCPGNACMHLQPFLTDSLAPGTSVVIRGRIGIHAGDRKSLTENIAMFLSADRQSNQGIPPTS